MKDLLPADRPREKLRDHGPAALGDNELVALVLGSGSRRADALSVANALLAAHGGVHGLTRCTADDFVRIAGIGRARAAQIAAALELGRRSLAHGSGERLRIRVPREAAEYLMPRFGSRAVEQFGIVLLDAKHRVVRTAVLAVGGQDSSIVQPREVFREAAIGGGGDRGVSHSSFRRSHPQSGRRGSDATAGRRGDPDGNRRGGPPHPGGRAVLELQGDRAAVSRVLYFDCFSGISGDMALGAMLDAGLPLDELKRGLGSLALGDAHVHADRVLRTGVSATKFKVHEHTHDHGQHHHHEHGNAPGHEAPHTHSHAHRSLPEIFALIDRSSLSAAGRERAAAMFRRLAEAEAAIHQMPVEQVHLHEVGALDSIIDIVGIVFAMEWAGADRIVCSPLNVGGGMVHSAHGVFPVPAPATVKLLGDAPVYSGAVQKELVTPTGALIATTYASSFGPIPAMAVERVGYGAGDRDNPRTPNVLRVLIGEAADQGNAERVTVVE